MASFDGMSLVAAGGMDPGVAQSQTPATPLTAQPPAYDASAVVGEVDAKYTAWRALKRPNEIQWFINNAVLRGIQNVRWNEALNMLEQKRQPSYKQRPSINKVLPKHRQRKAKFLKNRYKPVVVPASTDKEDKLNATASEKALEYVGRKQRIEHIYRRALEWTLSCGKGFVWLYWDDNAQGLMKNPLQHEVVMATIGDVVYESGSPFEVLVPDVGISDIGSQAEVMRVRALPLEELKLRHKNVPAAQNLKGDTTSDDLFQYQKQIATLSTKNNANMVGGASDKADRELNFVIVKELFTRPNSKYPKGKYTVVAGGQVLRYQEQLPYQFDQFSNPYPVVEFPDIELAGQFWPTSTVEQLIGPQLEYVDLRGKLINHLANCTHPKVIVSAHAKWPENAWSDEAGEVVKILLPPGVAAPYVHTPPPISGDLWRCMETIKQEIDEISSLPPVMSGMSAGATSGFQTNLLQEATDSVHAPDIRAHEMAFEELYMKTRKMMAVGYNVPRLISVVGRAHIPDVMEFSQNNIDENAEIIVNTGSVLANSPAVRTQQVIELWNAGILQDPNNPAEGQRKALTMLDSNGIGEFQEEKRRDEEKARLENLAFGRQEFVEPALPFDDHMIHITQHTDQMKTPEFDVWSDVQKKEIYTHTLYHMKFVNPQAAIQTALELGIPDIIPLLQPVQMAPPPGAPPPGAPPMEGPPMDAPPPPMDPAMMPPPPPGPM